jgi:D-beta-D-heptose 7-phosphate kinase/D-beta-D-heptose 1-phosphate adenosyltransferase
MILVAEKEMRNLVQVLKNSETKNVVVIGDIMLDEYLIGSVSRISPEAPVPILREKGRECSFGGAANVAANCNHVGCNVHMIGFIGDDDNAGKKLISMFVEKNIKIEGIVKTPDRVTTTKRRIVAKQQQLLRIDSENTQKLSSFERDSLICHIHTIIKPGFIVLISDYAKGVIDRSIIEEVIARAAVCDSLIVVDPKGPHFDKYKGVHYIKPNEKEFIQMIDFFGLKQEDSVAENGRKICEILSLSGLIITMGEKGIQFVSRDKYISYKACHREVYDITGAGDTVLAFLSVGLVHNFPIEESLKLANIAASIAVSHHKTYSVGLDELFAEEPELNEKIFSDWGRLKTELDWLRNEKKKKIVFTNGCFDLLHSGHIHLLREAKKKGDILVVAMNTDDSVTRFKGSGRPVKTLSERAHIMAAIDVVDYVIKFEQDTPREIIEFLKPDVLVKGGDYRLENISGYDAVTSYGGSVELVDYKQGLSTSNIVKSVKLAE